MYVEMAFQLNLYRQRCHKTDKTSTEWQSRRPSFREGLSRVLSELNATTTRNGISATMAHLIPCNDRSRFVFLHTFSDLLVGQMEAKLEGQETNVKHDYNLARPFCRQLFTSTNRQQIGQNLFLWHDSRSPVFWGRTDRPQTGSCTRQHH